MAERDPEGSHLDPQEVRHRLSEHDVARLGLRGWRRWSLGNMVGTTGRATFNVGLCLVIASLQLSSHLLGYAHGSPRPWEIGLALTGVIVFYTLTLVLYAAYRENVDDGVYARLAEARRAEAREATGARTR